MAILNLVHKYSKVVNTEGYAQMLPGKKKNTLIEEHDQARC